jgi:hypothetical protein
MQCSLRVDSNDDADRRSVRGSVSVWLLCIWITLFIIRPWERLAPWLAAIHIERLYAVAVVSVVVLAGSLRLCLCAQTIAIVLFVLALGISAACGQDYSRSSDGLYVLITIVVFGVALLSVVRTPYALMVVLIAYVGSMMLYLGKSEWEYFFNHGGQFAQGVRRLGGIDVTYGSPNGVAASTVLSLPVAYLLWRCCGWFTRDLPVFCRRLFRALLVGYLLIAVSSVILTNARAGYLGVIVFVFMAAISGKQFSRKLGAVMLVVTILGGVWLILPEENRNRFRTLWDEEAGPSVAHSSALGRVAGMQAGLEAFSSYPVTGVGIGNFVPYRIAHLDGKALEPHNLLGEVLAESGLLGATAFIFMLLCTVSNVRRTQRLAKGWREPTADVLFQTATACGQTLLLLLFLGLFSHNMLRFNWIWIAIFALLARLFMEEIAEAAYYQECDETDRS